MREGSGGPPSLSSATTRMPQTCGLLRSDVNPGEGGLGQETFAHREIFLVLPYEHIPASHSAQPPTPSPVAQAMQTHITSRPAIDAKTPPICTRGARLAAPVWWAALSAFF